MMVENSSSIRLVLFFFFFFFFSVKFGIGGPIKFQRKFATIGQMCPICTKVYGNFLRGELCFTTAYELDKKIPVNEINYSRVCL